MALLDTQNKGAKNVEVAGIFEFTEPLIWPPVEMSVTRYPIEVPLGALNIASSSKSVVFTGMDDVKSVTVGAVPVILFTNFQLPELVFIASPILPGVVLVVGSIFVGVAMESAKPTNARLPLWRVFIVKRVVKKNPPWPAELPRHTMVAAWRWKPRVPAVVPVVYRNRLIEVAKLVPARVGYEQPVAEPAEEPTPVAP